MISTRHIPAYRKPLVGDEDLFYVVSPGQVLAELQTVDAAVDSLARDVGRSKVADAFRSEFSAFRDSWKAYLRDNAGLMSRLSIKDYRKALEWRDRVDDWRSAFVQAGGSPTGPGLPENPGHKSPFSLSAKVAIAGIGLTVGLWFLSRWLPAPRRASYEATS